MPGAQPDTAVPTDVPVAAAPFDGAAPVPNFVCVVVAPAFAEFDIVPWNRRSTRVLYDGVILQVAPSPIITAVPLAVPVGFDGLACSVAFDSCRLTVW